MAAKPKVAVVRCPDYERERVFASVKKAVDLVGGINAFVAPGMKVLVKPNILSARPPEDAVDTHPEVVRAVARLAKEAGGDVMIGDSPGGYGKNIDEAFEVSGIKKVAEEEGARLVRFSASRQIEGMPIATAALEADRVISVPKLKTHSITVLTAAVKNTFGMVTGLHKAECHSRAPKAEDLAKILVKVYAITRPCLSVVDGIVAMDGDGPSAGRLRPLGALLAGTDAVAIDACAARMAGLAPLDVPVTKEAYARGLGEADLGRIDLVGDDLNGFVMKDFALPKTIRYLTMMPKPLLESFMYFVKFKPVIDSGTCKRCGLCAETCPVDAITVVNGVYKVDYHKCIKCLCCHEVCPYKAIEIKGNALTKLVWG
ncbi:MAG: DUF362 domain-containing protein [Candidatus Omnitrophica bacterium]|nr:DUF362 domain-containing protein [Candidatus Omnitrophota bacterium]